MERADIIEKINKTIDEITGDWRERKLTESLKDNCGLDSLSLVNLIVSLEEGLNISFDESALDPEVIKTIEDVVKLTEKYV